MSDKKVLSVGVMGYSDKKFDKEKALMHLQQAFDQIATLITPEITVEIVSGYTNLGIPALAYAEAVRRHWTTVGIACAKAKEFELFPCDEILIIGENWGNESPAFLERCDTFIRIGGGKHTMEETALAKAMGKSVKEYDLEELPE